MISKKIRIEIIYALPGEQTRLSLQIPRGTTVRQALALSNLAQKHPELILENATVGIFGQRVSGEVELNDRDRIEVYRPLRIDPKNARRARAASARRIRRDP